MDLQKRGEYTLPWYDILKGVQKIYKLLGIGKLFKGIGLIPPKKISGYVRLYSVILRKNIIFYLAI